MEVTLHKSIAEADSSTEPIVVGRERRSSMTVLGLPLVHVVSGRSSDGKRLKARGIIAIGQTATGVLCISQFGFGLVCVSQFSLSVLSLSQFTLAAFTVTQFGVCLYGIGQFLLPLLPHL